MLTAEEKHHFRTLSDQRAILRYNSCKAKHICPRCHKPVDVGVIVCDDCKFKQKLHYINSKKR